MKERVKGDHENGYGTENSFPIAGRAVRITASMRRPLLSHTRPAIWCQSQMFGGFMSHDNTIGVPTPNLMRLFNGNSLRSSEFRSSRR